MNAIPIDTFAASLGVASDQLKPLKAKLKRGKHWIVGRYNKTYLTAAGQDKLKELVASPVEQKADVEPVSDSETPPKADVAPSEVQNSLDESSLTFGELLAKQGINIDDEVYKPEPPSPIHLSDDCPYAAARSGLSRLLAENTNATVLKTRFTNRRILMVNFNGEERPCLCKDSRYFVPGMVIPVRQDGDNLVAKFQPRRLGKF